MLYFKTDNTIYANRKQLREKIGLNEYKREVKKGNIVYLADNLFENVQNDSNAIKTIRHNHYDSKQGL
jgi:hypothetical protein